MSSKQVKNNSNTFSPTPPLRGDENQCLLRRTAVTDYHGDVFRSGKNMYTLLATLRKTRVYQTIPKDEERGLSAHCCYSGRCQECFKDIINKKGG